MRHLTASAALAAAFASASSGVLAHPGHDHAHWSSPALHAIAIIALLAIGSEGLWALRRSRRQQAARLRVEDREQR